MRGAGRSSAAVALGSLGISVMTHYRRLLDLFSTIDRTIPVTAVPCGLRRCGPAVELRDTETPDFLLVAVSNVNIKLSCAHADYRSPSLFVCENR